MGQRRAVESYGCHRVEMVQRRAARCVISQYQPQESVTAMIDKLGWDTLEKRSAIARVTLATLSKQDSNATTTVIHTMIFLISYKGNE